MNTSFQVNGKKSSKANSTISHIERNHSLKKNPTKSSNEKSKNDMPNILVFRKNKRFEKPKESKSTHTKLAKQIQTYKSRLKKHLKELEKLEDQKKIELKQKTIQRQKDKIAELEKEKENTTRKRSGYSVDFVDIPFSITQCKPELLSKEEFEKLADIAEQVTLQLFEIDKEELGKVAHLDQASSHVHISFHVPPNKQLKEITKISYREAQLMFNKLVIEAFERLPIENICEEKNEPNKYLNLQEYKHECEKKNIKEQLDQKIKNKELTIEEMAKEIQTYSNQTSSVMGREIEHINKIAEKDRKIEELEQKVATLDDSLMRGNEEHHEAIAETIDLRMQVNDLESQKKVLEVKVVDLEEKSVSRPNMSDYERLKEIEKKYNDNRKRIQDLETDLQSGEKKTSGFFAWIKEKFNAFKEEIENKKAENTLLTKQINSLQLENDRLVEEMENLKNDVKVTDQLREDLEAELEKLTNQNEKTVDNSYEVGM